MFLINYYCPSIQPSDVYTNQYATPFNPQGKKSKSSETPIEILGRIEDLRERREEAKDCISIKSGKTFFLISSIDYTCIHCLAGVYVTDKFYMRL